MRGVVDAAPAFVASVEPGVAFPHAFFAGQRAQVDAAIGPVRRRPRRLSSRTIQLRRSAPLSRGRLLLRRKRAPQRIHRPSSAGHPRIRSEDRMKRVALRIGSFADAAPSFLPVAGIVTDRALACLVPSFASVPSTMTSSPTFMVLRVQPLRSKPFGGPISRTSWRCFRYRPSRPGRSRRADSSTPLW